METRYISLVPGPLYGNYISTVTGPLYGKPEVNQKTRNLRLLRYFTFEVYNYFQ